MGRIGHGYGSEWHLLRYLGRHRNLLDKAVRDATGCGCLDWLDFGFDLNNPWHDAEWKGLEFLMEDTSLQHSWRDYWPHGRGIHNWDAIARAGSGGGTEWILVEAKANLEELKSVCHAGNMESLRKINAALDATKTALGVLAKADWTSPFYQYCNRVAALHFLKSHGVDARLLFIYFCGDKGDARRTCPENPEAWKESLGELAQHVGLPNGHYLDGKIHTLFLPVTQGLQ
jgi:hypothetical protein